MCFLFKDTPAIPLSLEGDGRPILIRSGLGSLSLGDLRGFVGAGGMVRFDGGGVG
jgi:hypothetical protein